MTRARSLHVAVCALLAMLTTLAGLTGAPARAAGEAPPVTAPDSISTYPGSPLVVDPLENDSDPDTSASDLAVCRLGPEHYTGLRLALVDNQVGVVSRRNARPGAYTFTYYACDFTSLVPGTLTVTVLKPPHVRVSKLSGRPGLLRVTNPAPFSIGFLYGSPQASRPDGRFRVGAHDSMVFRVHRLRIVWVAFDPEKELFLFGRVKDIRLPNGEQPLPEGTGTSQRAVGGWSHAVSAARAVPRATTARAASVRFVVLRRPGRVRIVNDFRNQTFHCSWHGKNTDALDGRARVDGQTSVVAIVKHHSEEFTCRGAGQGYGTLISGIKLPPS